MDVSKLSVDVLAANLDKLPSLMAKLSISPKKSNKFPMLGPNHSYSMDELLRPKHHAGDTDEAFEASRNRRMKDQASQVIKHLNAMTMTTREGLSTNPPSVHDIGDIASVASKTLKNMSKSRNEKVNFGNFDVNRRSSISYETFSNLLSIGSSGLSPNQKYALASKIDENKSGVLDYNNIMDAIVHVESEHKSNKEQKRSAASASVAETSTPPVVVDESAAATKSKPSILKEAPEVKLVSFNDISDSKSNVVGNASIENNNAAAANTNAVVANNSSNQPLPRGNSYDRIFHISEIKSRHQIDHVKDILEPSTSNNSLCSRNVKDVFDAERDKANHTIKRMYHNSFSKNYEGAIPYYREDVSYTIRKDVNATTESQRAKRPSSAPPRNTKIAPPPAATTSSFLGSNLDDTSSVVDSYHSYMFSSQSPKSKHISHSDIDTTVEETKDAIVESSIACQLSGNINGLRHNLRKIDVSRSGSVNFDEFKSVMNKLEIEVPKKNLEKYFHKHADNTLMDSSHKTEGVLDIDNFVSDMTHVSSNSPTLLDKKGSLAANDERRIFKHISHSMNKNSDPLLVFKHLNEHNRGFLTPSQLKEGFQRNGTVISDREFSLLLNKLNSNSDGLIALSDVNQILHKACNEHDVDEKIRLADKYRENRRYSRSYQSNVTTLALHSKQEEYNSFAAMSKIHKEESLLWHKLKGTLRDRHRDFTKLFSNNSDANSHNIKNDNLNEKIDFQELSHRMDKAGIQLGNDDKTILAIQLQRHAGSDKFDFKTFCTMFDGAVIQDNRADGFREGVRRRPPHVHVAHPHSLVQDGGLFANATQDGNNTYATTMLAENSELNIFEHQKRKHGKPLAEYCLEPSKFWAMPHGFDVDPLLPHPLPNYRDNYQFSSQNEGTRIALNSSICKNALQPTPRSQLRQSLAPKCLMNDIIFGSSTANTSNPALYSSSHLILVEGGGKKRPLSAPPRTALRSSGHRLNLFPERDQASAATDSSSNNDNSNNSNAKEANIQASFAPTPLSATDSNASSYIPPATLSRNTNQSPTFASSPKRTLRKKQIQPIGVVVSGAPFALNY